MSEPTIFDLVQKRFDDYFEALEKGDIDKLKEMETKLAPVPITYADLFKLREHTSILPQAIQDEIEVAVRADLAKESE